MCCLHRERISMLIFTDCRLMSFAYGISIARNFFARHMLGPRGCSIFGKLTKCVKRWKNKSIHRRPLLTLYANPGIMRERDGNGENQIVFEIAGISVYLLSQNTRTKTTICSFLAFTSMINRASISKIQIVRLRVSLSS